MTRYNRHALALLVGTAFTTTAAWAENPTISVYKSPTCTCCEKWIAHLEQEGFLVDAIDTSKAIGGNWHTRLRRIFVRLQGAPTGAQSNYATVGATPKTGEKTSKMVCQLTEIA